LLLDYIAVYVEMLARMVLDRREEPKRHFEENLGIDFELCEAVLRLDNCYMKIKSSFLYYLENAYIDQNPLNRLSTYRNRCIKYDKIQSRDIKEVPIIWLNAENSEIVDNAEIRYKYNYNQVNELISLMVQRAFFIETDKLMEKHKFDAGPTHDADRLKVIYHESETEKSDEDIKIISVERCLEYQANILNFIRNCIDIGFCDTDKVTLIFKLVGLILSSTSDDCKVANSFSKILEYAKNITQLKPKVKMISLNAIKILEVLGHLRLQTQ
jgi:hypothetical protein